MRPTLKPKVGVSRGDKQPGQRLVEDRKRSGRGGQKMGMETEFGEGLERKQCQSAPSARTGGVKGFSLSPRSLSFLGLLRHREVICIPLFFFSLCSLGIIFSPADVRSRVAEKPRRGQWEGRAQQTQQDAVNNSHPPPPLPQQDDDQEEFPVPFSVSSSSPRQCVFLAMLPTTAQVCLFRLVIDSDEHG